MVAHAVIGLSLKSKLVLYSVHQVRLAGSAVHGSSGSLDSLKTIADRPAIIAL
jgi:hypothetical protein